MLPYKSVSWINFDVATELIAHGRQHLFGLPRLAMECSRVKLLGDLSRGRLPRSPPLRGFCAWFPAEVAMTEGEFDILRASLVPMWARAMPCSAIIWTRSRELSFEREKPPHTQHDDFLIKMPSLEEILCRRGFRHPGSYRRLAHSVMFPIQWLTEKASISFCSRIYRSPAAPAPYLLTLKTRLHRTSTVLLLRCE